MKMKGWVHTLRRMVPLLLFCATMLTACSPSRYVRPLAHKEVALSATLGGPLFTNFGAPMPTPMTTVSGAYGFSERITGFSSFHPTSAAFGVIQVDAGAVACLVRSAGWQPGLSFSPTLGFAVDVWEGRAKLWPQLDMNAWWEYGKRKHYFYAGFSCWIEPAATRAHGEPQPQTILPAFQLGNVLSFNSWDVQVELKANNFTRPNGDATISWVGLGGRGGIGVYLGVGKRLGGRKHEN